MHTQARSENSNVNQESDLPDQISFILHLKLSFET